VTGDAVSDSTLDFTSSLFLGLRHSSDSLPPWASLTTGAPAVLREAAGLRRVGDTVAAWQGAQAGLAGRSALHALMDVLGTLPGRGDILAVDAAAYPITEWAALRAAAAGAVVCRYPHHRPQLITPPAGRRLFLVADGWCQGCGRPAPLAESQWLARSCGGALVIDDSLAFGVLGLPRPGEAFGDGSGTPRWCGLDHDGVVWVASLAKAYGAPLAVTTGDRTAVERLAADGGNRIHSSAPSAADVAAATVALAQPRRNRALRARLLAHTLRVRGCLREAGLPVSGPPFPVVSVRLPGTGDARRWWSHLRSRGIRTVVQQPRCRGGALLTVLLRADHSDGDIERLVSELRVLAREAA